MIRSAHPHCVGLIAMTAILLMGISTAQAGDYTDKDFTLRFPAAMTRFAIYGDVAGVGDHA